MEKQTCWVEVLPWYMKMTGPNLKSNVKIKCTCKHLPKMISVKYSTEITQKAGKYLKLWEKNDSLLDQSSYVTYLTWYRLLLFLQEFTSIILFLAWFQDSGQIKGRGTFSCLVWSVNESDILNLIYLKFYLVCEGQHLPWFWKIFIFNPLYNFKIAVQIYKPIM